ncbi:glycosyltransferase [Corynebacterium sp. HMSC072D12]|uniref:glycosyltransferase n=1 Tax=Corynebacterium sp. HMSC072D12 TaxID=1739447 RepID=UPI00114D38C1|nr:glycosyltransferase [Corynebacterium sp. HMSC072D12]
MISSNGGGLGHLTRLWAIEKNLSADVLTYSMSSAYHQLGKPKGRILYFPSHGDLGMHPRLWSLGLAGHLGAVVDVFRPHAIIFDGTYVYRGVQAVSKLYKVPIYWVQRGCWKKEVDKKSKQRHRPIEFASLVIVPGDYGCEESVDMGELQPEYVPPVVLNELGAAASRDSVLRKLGFDTEKKYVLIQLGGGIIDDNSRAKKASIKFVQQLGEDWEPVVVKNPLEKTIVDSSVKTVSAFPLSDLFPAFEFGIFAAGYNSVQESIQFGLPAAFIPNLETKTDDQLLRAQTINSRGLGFLALDDRDLRQSIERLAEDQVRANVRERMSEVKETHGALLAAKLIERKIMDTYEANYE